MGRKICQKFRWLIVGDLCSICFSFVQHKNNTPVFNTGHLDSYIIIPDHIINVQELLNHVVIIEPYINQTSIKA